MRSYFSSKLFGCCHSPRQGVDTPNKFSISSSNNDVLIPTGILYDYMSCATVPHKCVLLIVLSVFCTLLVLVLNTVYIYIYYLDDVR